jgi:GMP synthase (glutamine-hydrolysing)
MRTCLAIRHVPFEDLGTLGPVLEGLGYAIRYAEAGLADLRALDVITPDILVVLGGPIGVHETEHYPFLLAERALVRARLNAARPTLGLCLGAQLMCAALGAQVAPGPQKEIGYAPVALTEAGAAGPLRHLDGLAVLHWHGDQMALPDGATCLASTDVTPVQAWSLATHALAVQFHPEADGATIEQWLVGHAHELAVAKVDPRAVRADAARHGTALEPAGAALLCEWLAAAT